MVKLYDLLNERSDEWSVYQNWKNNRSLKSIVMDIPKYCFSIYCNWIWTDCSVCFDPVGLLELLAPVKLSVIIMRHREKTSRKPKGKCDRKWGDAIIASVLIYFVVRGNDSCSRRKLSTFFFLCPSLSIQSIYMRSGTFSSLSHPSIMATFPFATHHLSLRSAFIPQNGSRATNIRLTPLAIARAVFFVLIALSNISYDGAEEINFFHLFQNPRETSRGVATPRVDFSPLIERWFERDVSCTYPKKNLSRYSFCLHT